MTIGFTSPEGMYTLGCLSQRPMTIWELSEQLLLAPGLSWVEFEPDRVSRELHFLQQRKHVEWSRDSGSGQRVYSITEEARQALAAHLLHKNVVKDFIHFGFDLVVNAFGVLTPEAQREVIAHRREVVQTTRATYQDVVATLDASRPARRAILQHHLAYLEVELNWLDQLEADLETWDAETSGASEEPTE